MWIETYWTRGRRKHRRTVWTRHWPCRLFVCEFSHSRLVLDTWKFLLRNGFKTFYGNPVRGPNFMLLKCQRVYGICVIFLIHEIDVVLFKINVTKNSQRTKAKSRPICNLWYSFRGEMRTKLRFWTTLHSRPFSLSLRREFTQCKVADSVKC